MRETTSYEPSCIKIGSVVFAVSDGKKKRKDRGETGRYKSHASVIFYLIVGKPSLNGFLPNFAHQEVYRT